MANYHRAWHAGGTNFFTVNLLQRRGSDMLTRQIDLLRRVVRSVRAARGERGIWQRRYWEHVIRNDTDMQACIDYVHFNPMPHGLVIRVADWPHSTFCKRVKAGIYSPDRAGGVAGSLGYDE